MPNSDQAADFSRLLMAHQPRLYGFVYTLVHDHASTEEILQDVATVLWNKFDRFEPGSDFGAWAMKVARFSVFEWRRQQAKLPLPMSDDLFTALSETAMEVSCNNEDKLEALSNCVRQLGESDRILVKDRYEKGLPVLEIASRGGRTRGAVYKILARIHRDLLSCVRGKLSKESMS